MILSGFTDEASDQLEDQIRVSKLLGWSHLSARTISGQNIHDISEAEFSKVVEQLNESGIKVAEFGTLIGNWGKSVQSDFDITLSEIDRCIPRMQMLGVKYARVMSYAQYQWGEDHCESVRFQRLRESVSRFKFAGLEALHENCMNWGGFSADHTLRLLDEVPGLGLVFDTGNPIFQKDRSKKEPFPWQDSFEFYEKVKHAIKHVHIKDAKYPAPGNSDPTYTFAGEGDAHVYHILSDLISNGYSGFIAIEPHVSKVFHQQSDDKANDSDHFTTYLEYGKKFSELIKSVEENSQKID